MPEGPEVETIRRGLADAITGQQITGLEVLLQKCFPANSQAIRQNVVGARVLALRRKAKVLLIDLDSEYSLMFHLKMTGQLVLIHSSGVRLAGGHPSGSMAGDLPDTSTRAIIEFASADRLYFNDQRKFGWIKLVLTTEVELDALVARLGPEVLSPEFSAHYLARQLARHKGSSVKAVLLDQSVVGGIGNIYADESLHLAGLHPGRRAGSLRDEESHRLWAATRNIIELGIEYGGTSFAKYVNALGGKGDYLDHARVFRRQGQPCLVCGTIIIKLRVAGRGTHICPRCQIEFGVAGLPEVV